MDELRHRIRWENVARLVALTAVVVFVVAWLRAGDHEPQVPSAMPRPVVPSTATGSTAAAPPGRSEDALPSSDSAAAAALRGPVGPPAHADRAAVTTPEGHRRRVRRRKPAPRRARPARPSAVHSVERAPTPASFPRPSPASPPPVSVAPDSSPSPSPSPPVSPSPEAGPEFGP